MITIFEISKLAVLSYFGTAFEIYIRSINNHAHCERHWRALNSFLVLSLLFNNNDIQPRVAPESKLSLAGSSSFLHKFYPYKKSPKREIQKQYRFVEPEAALG
ncbi:hypothetical protein KQX54_020272 [Cotesia glomerata]|uniref:Uncharacterized protein n=1 Tax=Cotesia glomerata TaxID=32391 RepID=A0AAV7IPK7_COTGL|nr:hypothetical protein KQX54_020272 [Cotesia glomerata]